MQKGPKPIAWSLLWPFIISQSRYFFSVGAQTADQPLNWYLWSMLKHGDRMRKSILVVVLRVMKYK